MRRFLASLLAVLFVTSPVFAGRTAVTQSSLALLTTSATAVATNISRNFLLLQNDSNSNDAYCSFKVNAAINSGFRLNAGGGNILLDDKWPTDAVFCLATAVPTKLLIIEGTGP